MAAHAPLTLDELLRDEAAALRLGYADAVRLLGEVAEHLARVWHVQSVLLIAAARRPGAAPETDSLLTMEQVAERLAVPVAHAREMGRRHELPTVKVGRYVRVRESTLRAWLQQHEEMDNRPPRAYHPRPKKAERPSARVVPLRHASEGSR